MKLPINFFSVFSTHPRPSGDGFVQPTVPSEGDRLRALLASTTPANLTLEQIRKEIAGNLWMLTPAAFQYLLPAFFTACLEHFSELRNFTAELVGAITEPSLDDIQQSLDDVAQIPANMGISPETLNLLRQQQVDWFNSGSPSRVFKDRVKDLSAAEGTAVLTFLVMIRDTYGKEFPLGEPQVAIDRFWIRFKPNN